MESLYDDDVIAWASQQIALLRTGQFAQLDIENIIEEIDDVARREKRELQSRMVVLVSHLLKWKFQPSRRGHSWINTIHEQRVAIEEDIKDCPSLKPLLRDAKWLAGIYRRARARTVDRTQVKELPNALPWPVEKILSEDFFPEPDNGGRQ